MRLIVEERGKQVTYELPDEGEPATIGRGLENTIPIRDPVASRRHVKISRLATGGFEVADQKSKNGTVLNGQKLGGPRSLTFGDCVQVGETKIWFGEKRGEPAPAPSARPDARTESARAAAQVPTAERPAAKVEGFSPSLSPSPASVPALEPPPAEAEAEPEPEASEEAGRGGTPPATPPNEPDPALVRGAEVSPAEGTEAVVDGTEAIARPAATGGTAVMPRAAPPPGGLHGPPAGRYVLEALEGELTGRRIAMERFPFGIGRTRKNAVILKDGGVSSEHCEIVARGDGCAIVDKGSTNGTKVNGARVKRAVLADGARVGVGASVFVFRDTAAARLQADLPKKDMEPPRAKAGAPVAVRRAARGPISSPDPGAPAKKLDERTKTPDEVEPAAAAQPLSPDPDLEEPSGGLESAVAGMGQGAAGDVEAEAEALGGSRAPAIAGIAFVLLAVLGAAALLVVSSGRRSSQPTEVAPPRGSQVKNWSFEDEAIGDDVPGWRPGYVRAPGSGRLPDVESVTGALTIAPGAGAAIGPSATERGGGRAARIVARDRAVVAWNVSTQLLRGQDVAVRALVKGGRGFAGLLVSWESSADPGLRLVSATDLAPVAARAGGLTEVRAVLRAPRGADTARVGIVGDDALFDRVSLVEEEPEAGPRGEPQGGQVEARGVTLRCGARGAFELFRDDRAVVDRGTLALLGEGPAAGLSRQETALAAAPRAVSADAITIAGRLLLPAGSGSASFEETAGADPTTELRAGKEAVRVRYRLEKPVAGVAPAIVLYMEDGSRLSGVEISKGGEQRRVDAPFDEDGVEEIVLGIGSDEVALRPDAPLHARAERLGRGALLTLGAAPGDAAVGLSCGRGSSRERALIDRLFTDADAARKAGRLEEARRAYARIGREHGRDADVHERAVAAVHAIELRAETALGEADLIESDIAAVGVADLLTGAQARCRFILEAFPGTEYSKRGQALLLRMADAGARIEGDARAARAREMLMLARRDMEANRPRLARLTLRAILARAAEGGETAAAAKRELESAEKRVAEADR